MKTIHDDLRICCLDRESHLRTCGYWYLVYSRSSNHCAFARRESLLRWPADRGTFARAVRHRLLHLDLSQEDLDDMAGDRVRVMSNGEYVAGVVTRDEDGRRVVHYLNPNARDRRTYDYRDTRADQG